MCDCERSIHPGISCGSAACNCHPNKDDIYLVTTGKRPAKNANPEVDHPKHYNTHPSGVECIEVVRHMGFNLGNVVKYLWRDGIKETEVELQDLEKAAWYLQDEINVRKKAL